MNAIFTSKKTWLALLIVALVGGLGWSQREQIQAWYLVRQLANADQENREEYASKVAALEESAIPQVLNGLNSDDALVCGNLQFALMMVTQKWGRADARTVELVAQLHGRFDSFSAAGQEKTVLLLAGLMQMEGSRPLSPPFTKHIGAILLAADRKPELRSATLLLAAELIDAVEPGQWVDACKAMAERGLKDDRPAARVAAIQLVRREPIRKDKQLLEQAIPLLRDAQPAVRRAALLVLAAESELVREEVFLPLLHDDDVEVQYLCELALRKRGLQDDDLAMARLISDKNPATRMRVLGYLHQRSDINLGEWLRQLSHDAEPAVRAAAIRACAEMPHVNMTDRLREMAERDPSETVRQNARYYLSLRSVANR